MFKSFKVVNFRAILETTIPLTYMERKAPNGYKKWDTIPFLESGKDRIVPLLMLFGANASGKTTITSAFSLYMHILQEGIRGKYFPNKLNKKYNSTLLELSFSWEDADYTHLIEYDQTHIIREVFLRKGKTIFEIQNQKIVKQTIETRGYGIEEFNNILTVECSEGKNQIHTFLTKLAERLPGLDKNLSGAYQYLRVGTRVITSGESLNPAHMFEAFRAIGLSIEKVLSDITSILQRLDINILRLQLIKEEKTLPFVVPVLNPLGLNRETQQIKQTVYSIISYHKDKDGKEVLFDFFHEESSGTIRLFSILGVFLLALHKGGVIVWDEVDNALHPYLLKELLKIFKSKQYNTKKAQLIVSLHEPSILEEKFIRISDVAFLNNTVNTGTTLARIGNISKVRNDLNFRKQYLQNQSFGGVPKITLYKN